MRKGMKRELAVFLVFVMILSLIPANIVRGEEQEQFTSLKCSASDLADAEITYQITDELGIAGEVIAFDPTNADAGGAVWERNVDMGGTAVITVTPVGNRQITGVTVYEDEGMQNTAYDGKCTEQNGVFVYTFPVTQTLYVIHVEYGNDGGSEIPDEGDNNFLVNVDGITVFDSTITDNPDTEQDERICVPDTMSDSFAIYVDEEGRVVIDPVRGTGIRRDILDREDVSEEEKDALIKAHIHQLSSIETKGEGTVLVNTGLNYGEDGVDSHIEEIVPVSIAADDSGYSFCSTDGKGKFMVSGGGTFGSSLWLNGKIKSRGFSTGDIGRIYIGTKEQPIEGSVFEACLRNDNSIDDGSFVELVSGSYEIYTTGTAFENYGSVSARDEADIQINCKTAFEQVNHVSVQTGGGFNIASEGKTTISDGMLQARYYNEANEILTIPAEGRMQDYVNTQGIKSISDMERTEENGIPYIVDNCSDTKGRYLFKMKEDGTGIYFKSTTRTLYSLAYRMDAQDAQDDDLVKNGNFEISAGSGLMAEGLENRGEYWFEEGTEVYFTLVPDYGYRYEKGTFQFNGNNSEEVVKPLEKPGTYLFVMPSNPVHVSCNFISADNEVDVEGTEIISNVTMEIPRDNLNGIARFTVKDTDLDAEELSAVKEQLKDNYEVGATLDLGLNEVIDRVGHEDAWVTPREELSEPMSVSLQLDENASFFGYQQYEIIREHDGACDTLAAVYDETAHCVTFETDRYSHYTIAYKADSAKTYDINYVLGKGKNHADNPLQYTGTKIILKAPVRAGYTFGGWYGDASYKNPVSYIASDNVQTLLDASGKISIYAKWTANKYSIKFEGRYATSGSMTSVSGTYRDGAKLPENQFKRVGYYFTGWSDSDGNFYKNQADLSLFANSSTAKTVTLYTKWKLYNYKLNYVLNGGTNHVDNPATYTYKTDTITLRYPKKRGYTFAGWYTDAGFKHRVTQIKKGSVGSKKLYAKWTPTKYRITYVLNGGKNNKNNPSVYTVTTNSFTYRTPTRAGYIFQGWYTDKKCTKRTYQVKKGTIGNKTIYAKWKLK